MYGGRAKQPFYYGGSDCAGATRLGALVFAGKSGTGPGLTATGDGRVDWGWYFVPCGRLSEKLGD